MTDSLRPESITPPSPDDEYERDNETQYRRLVQGWMDDTSALLGFLRDAVDTLGGFPIMPDVGRWYRGTTSSISAQSLFSLALDTLYFVSFTPNRRVLMDRVAVDVRAQGPAGAEMKLAIYANAPHAFRPDEKLVESVIIDAQTTGIKEHIFTADIEVRAGQKYWLGMIANDASIQVRGFNADEVLPLGAATADDALNNGGSTYCSYVVAPGWDTGVLPTTIPSVVWGAEGVFPPSMTLRIA